jgi:hypothetical protein
MKKVLFFLFMTVLLTFGCGHNEGIIQKAERSYLKFTGNRTKAVVELDGSRRFLLPDMQGQDDDDKLYQVSPGKHELKVYRSGQLIVNRVIVLDDQTTTEVALP